MKIQYQERKSKRLDKYLTGILTELPRLRPYSNRISREVVGSYIPTGVYVNGDKVKKSEALKYKDSIEFDLNDFEQKLIKINKEKLLENEILPEKGDLEIIFENKDYLVINKASGVVMHPGAGNKQNTLANSINWYLNSIGCDTTQLYRSGIVHRLDKDVSGLVVVAKNIGSQRSLIKQFEAHKVLKLYYAQVVKLGASDSLLTIEKSKKKIQAEVNKIETHFREDTMSEVTWQRYEGYISRDSTNRRRNTFKPLSSKGKYSLSLMNFITDHEVLILIKTGRMHQIRATLRYNNYTIIGDEKYGYRGLIRDQIFLKSILLGFNTLSGEKVCYKLV